MNSLKMSLENCYGIRRLEATLYFSRGRNVAIYASNGTIKSSLAHVFKDVRDGAAPGDRIYGVPGRFRILCDDEPIEPDSILVFDPTDEKDEAQTSAGILVNNGLRTEYNSIVAEIRNDIAPLVRRLNKLSGVAKNSIPATMHVDFGAGPLSDVNICDLLLAYKNDPDEPDDQDKLDDLKHIKYTLLFNDATEKLFKHSRFKKLISQYTERHEKLTSPSESLRGRSDHHAAGGVQNVLDESEHFDAGRMAVFKPKPGHKDDPEEIKKAEPCTATTEKQKDTIKKELDSDWKAMEKILSHTSDLDAVRLLLAENRWLIPMLSDTAALKRSLWLSYLSSAQALVAGVCDKCEHDWSRLQTITEKAEYERPAWMSIVEEFVRRFHVPFSVEVTNQDEALLGISVPALLFTYRGAGGEGEVDRGLLKSTLSDGERRALYILNMLFEVQKQIDSGKETVVVIDDLADSFDYKNKYAIVHYLKEVLDRPGFHMVILTHNFDFLRTIKSRDIVSGKQVFLVNKKLNKTTLQPAKIHDNPLDAFIGDLAKPASLIAAIPFARNIVEYTRGKRDVDYIELTRFLHWRERTDQVTVSELIDILDRTFPKARVRDKGIPKDDTVFGTIIDEANRCSHARTEGDLKEKIVLSIATRLLAERFLTGRLLEGHAPPVEDAISIHDLIDDNRQILEERARAERRPLNEHEAREMDILNDVALMTPEAIHINSFMYEPILDMPSRHLSDLYKSVRELVGEASGA